MKRVVDTSEVPHLWAHKTQSDARNSHGNFYFENETIYSYGRHFPIAKHVTNRRKESAVVLTTRGYSVTTSGHINCVAGAIPHGTQIFRVNFDNSWEPGRADIVEYNRHIAEHELKAARAKKQWSIDYELRCAGELHTEALAFCKFYGLRFKVNLLHSDLSTVKAAAAADTARKVKEAKIAKVKLAKENADQIEAWLRGEFAHIPYGVDTLLRVKNGNVETSRGASFPVDHAKRGLVLVESVKASGESWQRNGHTCHLGHYQIDRIEANGTVHAGCHVVTYAAIERIREQIIQA